MRQEMKDPKKHLFHRLFTKLYLRNLTPRQKVNLSPKNLLLSFFNSLLLLFITLLIQYLPYVHPDEVVLLKWYEKINNGLHAKKNNSLGKDIVFVDVSKDLELIAPGDSIFSEAKIPIVNRQALATFFKEAKKNSASYRLLVCDLLFEGYSPNDSLLQCSLNGLKKCLFAAYEEGVVDTRIKLPNAQMGNVEYISNNDLFLKGNVYYRGKKTLPVRMFETQSKFNFRKWKGIITLNYQLSFRYVVPHYYLQDFRSPQENDYYKKIYLGVLLQQDSFFTSPILKDKIIVIGNLERDIHKTTIGEMPGAVILANTYLTFKNAHPWFAFHWFFIFFLTFFALSLRLFSGYTSLEEAVKKLKTKWIRKYVLSFLAGFGILQITNFIFYLYTGVFLSIFYSALYLTCLKFIIEKFPIYIVFAKKLKNKLKWATLTFLIIICQPQALCQPYEVQGINGQFTCKGKVVAKKDILYPTDELLCTSKVGKITFLDRKDLTLRTISYVNNKANISSQQRGSGVVAFLLGKIIPATEVKILGERGLDSNGRQISFDNLERELQDELLTLHENEQLIISLPETMNIYSGLNLVVLLHDEFGHRISLSPSKKQNNNSIKFAFMVNPEIMNGLNEGFLRITFYLLNGKDLMRNFSADCSYIATADIETTIKEEIRNLRVLGICGDNFICKKRFLLKYIQGTYGFVDINLTNIFLNKLIP
jgi:hypothetical protein